MTGTTKHSPRTELVELVAVSQGAPGEGLLSSPSLSLLSLLGFSVMLLFAIADAGSAGGSASGWEGGTDGESTGRTTVLGGGRYPASSGFAEAVGCINQ
jgi:hypothetical protein